MNLLAEQPENIVARRRKNCAQLFILFKGAVGKFMLMEPTQFLAETDLLSRNLIMIRDPHKAFYQRGVSQTIGDFDALMEWLAAYRNELPHVKEVYCVGVSMGSFAAVAAGARLKANAVFAFGLVTNLVGTYIANRSELLQELQLRDEEVDLAKLLSTYNGVSEYHVYYSEGCEQDRLRVERIAGLPGVRLKELRGNKHNTIESLKDHGMLGSVFPPYRAAGGPDSNKQ